MTTSWREMLQEQCKEDGEDFSALIHTLTEKQLDAKFDDGYGSTEGDKFTAWGKNWVYFPICYDGQEWVGHAPRNPCETAMEHQGGG